MSAFAEELRRAMTKRGLTQTALARRSGYGASNLHRVLSDGRIPAPDVITRLADALAWPSLVERAIADRTGRCAMCGAPFVRHHKKPSTRYCGRLCQRAAVARQSRDHHRRKVLTETRLVRQRLDQHQLAVLAFCRGCEPDGECRTPECSLRPVSPLRLAQHARLAWRVHGFGCVWFVLTCAVLGFVFLGAVVVDAIGRLLGA